MFKDEQVEQSTAIDCASALLLLRLKTGTHLSNVNIEQSNRTCFFSKLKGISVGKEHRNLKAYFETKFNQSKIKCSINSGNTGQYGFLAGVA